ncbi:hypothetical protein [Arthrobacter sp. efr-133-TYG-118]|uniref:hypothetical protein n=1 Tax=Arthrobacter sp. efr-133-TYG-118 TaxID=3040279 RepID=UPI00254BC7F5|nr:hypothetical protein [Arthrobacter sp. efr-133-TYG-118]
MTSPEELRRLRWSVPAADVSVNEWLDAQASISHSLRLLIRESIERDGFIDVTYRPVKQLPRRGRPPQGEVDEESRAPQDAGLDDADVEPVGTAPEPEEQPTPPVKEESVELAPDSPAPQERSGPPSGLKDMLGI